MLFPKCWRKRCWFGGCWLSALLALAAPCFAQDRLAVAFATEIRSISAQLESQPTLGAWSQTHLHEKPAPADYQADQNWTDSDFRYLNSRCAFSTAHPSSGFTRTALFLVPLVAADNLPPLPASASAALLHECRLEESWLEANAEVPFDALVRALSSKWGPPNGPSRSFRNAVWSVSERQGIVAWHRAGMNVWLVTRWDALSKLRAVYLRNDIVPAPTGWYDAVPGLQNKVRLQSAAAVAQVADLAPALTQAMLRGANCQAAGMPALPKTEEIFGRWLRASKSLSRPRRAAALLLADYYVSCLQLPLPQQPPERWAAFGVHFDHDGGYIHAFRDQARELDAHGVAGEWAALHAFWEPCGIAYGDALKTGDGLAQRFPEWRVDISYALARAHLARLSFAYPSGPPEGPDLFRPDHLSASERDHERESAIRYFQVFLSERPAGPDAVFAWQEVWRLQAGLKPTRVPFGCTGE